LSKKGRGEIIEIDVYDQRYPLRLSAEAERANIMKLAEEVDLRMREIAQQTGTVDSLKVAILTALHLAQELQDRAIGEQNLEVAVDSGSQKWIREIDKIL
jgi:cell division protein ZapA